MLGTCVDDVCIGISGNINAECNAAFSFSLSSSLPLEVLRCILVHLPLQAHALHSVRATCRKLRGVLADVIFARVHVLHVFAVAGHSDVWEWLDACSIRDTSWRALPFAYRCAVASVFLAADDWEGINTNNGGRGFGPNMEHNKMWFRRWLLPEPEAVALYSYLASSPAFDIACQLNRPFRWAARSGYLQVVQTLMKDPRVNIADDGNYAIYCAASSNELKIVNLLLDDPRCDPSAENQLALQYSVELGHFAVAERLLRDPRVHPSIRESNAAIRLACDNGHADIVRLLLADPRVDPSDSNNYSIIMASRNGHVDVVKLLLANSRVDCGANLNEAVRDASANGHVEIVRLLMQQPNCNPSDHNNSAIRDACSRGHVEVVSALLTDPRVDPSSENNQPIRLAAWQGRHELVKLLLADSRVDPTANSNQAFRNLLHHSQAEARSHSRLPPTLNITPVKKYLMTLKLLAADGRVKAAMTDKECLDLEGVLAM
ncbi:hypothetical protein HDU83_004690 [Entophlyctis luteolus]|nr:hypothetical protein HDU83_004690 [Entophlyctis luteolus]